MTETSSSGEGFMAELCQQWEAASLLQRAEVRRTIVRMGECLPPGFYYTQMALRSSIGKALPVCLPLQVSCSPVMAAQLPPCIGHSSWDSAGLSLQVLSGSRGFTPKTPREFFSTPSSLLILRFSTRWRLTPSLTGNSLPLSPGV